MDAATEPIFSPRDGLALWVPLPPKKHPLELACEHSVKVGMLSLEAPEGFGCDGASIPGLLEVLFRVLFGWRTLVLIHAAGIQHDYGYRVQVCTRFQCDAAFRSIMTAYRINPAAIMLCYLGVRLFGWIAWRRNAKGVDAARRKWHFDPDSEGLQK